MAKNIRIKLLLNILLLINYYLKLLNTNIINMSFLNYNQIVYDKYKNNLKDFKVVRTIIKAIIFIHDHNYDQDIASFFPLILLKTFTFNHQFLPNHSSYIIFINSFNTPTIQFLKDKILYICSSRDIKIYSISFNFLMAYRILYHKFIICNRNNWITIKL